MNEQTTHEAVKETVDIQPKKASKFNFTDLLAKYKKMIIYTLVGLLVVGLIYFLVTKVFKPAPKSIYEVAIMVRSQNNSDPVEDRKNSLKSGDVLVVQKDGHTWSRNEKISYLILKMELSEEQKQKLTSPEEREIKFKELSEEEQQRIEEEKKRAEEEDREYFEEPRTETLRARAYHIPLSQKEFEGFKALDLLNGQPYFDQVFDWSIVEEKEKVKQ